MTARRNYRCAVIPRAAGGTAATPSAPCCSICTIRVAIGSLSEPLIEPDEDEREGYVPNVLYTCGAIVHAGQLVVPYGFSDAGIAVAQLTLVDLLDALLSS